MDKPTLIKSRTSNGTIWIEERHLLQTDEVVVQFPKEAPASDLEKQAIILAVAARRKRKYRAPGEKVELVGPKMTSPEVVQHLKLTGRL